MRKAWPSRKSPTSTLAWLPQIMRAVFLPRRIVALVDDIVVQQRRRVHELDGRGEPDVAVAADSRTACATAIVSIGRSRLPPRVDEMMRELGDQLDVGDGLVEDDAVDRLHILRDDVEQRLQALACLANIFKWYNATQVGPQINYVGWYHRW